MKTVMVEVSARHLHLTKEHQDILFGEDYEMHPKKNLSQPGQFACEEKVQVIGPKGSLKMSVLGPCRSKTQIEVALTDARVLGIKAPIRMSGDLEGTPGCKLVGPCGEVELEHGVIVAQRHLHVLPADAAEWGVKDGQMIELKMNTEGRSLTFGDVVARVSANCGTAVHLDTDEANAGNISGTVYGEVIAK